MTGVPDPRDTVRAPANQHAGAGCRNGGRCAGSGWVQVTPAYAEKLFPMPPQPSLETQDQAAEWAAIAKGVESRRKAAADSWYPCKDCNGAVFYRWAGHHLESGHARSGCPECELAAELSGRPARKRDQYTPAPAGPLPEQF